MLGHRNENNLRAAIKKDPIAGVSAAAAAAAAAAAICDVSSQNNKKSFLPQSDLQNDVPDLDLIRQHQKSQHRRLKHDFAPSFFS